MLGLGVVWVCVKLRNRIVSCENAGRPRPRRGTQRADPQQVVNRDLMRRVRMLEHALRARNDTSATFEALMQFTELEPPAADSIQRHLISPSMAWRLCRASRPSIHKLWPCRRRPSWPRLW